MTSIILEASDEKFGQLSCNFPSTYLNGSTLSQYVLQKGVSKISNMSKMVSYKDATGEFKKMMAEAKEKYLNDAVSKLPIDPSFNSIEPAVVRYLYFKKIQQKFILDVYLNIFTEIDGTNLTLSERTELSDTLVENYREGKLDSVPGLTEEMDRLFMNQLIFGEKITIGQYVSDMVSSNTKNITEVLILIMNEGIQKRISNEPDFMDTLASVPLNLSAPVSDDEDVLEHLNTELLNMYRDRLASEDVTMNGMLEKSISKKSMQSTTVNIASFVSKVAMYVESKDNSVTMDTETVTKILRLAFPHCGDLYVSETPVADKFKSVMAGIPGFEKVDPTIIWKYYLRYISVNGVSSEVLRSSSAELLTSISRVGDLYIKSTPKKTLNAVALDDVKTRRSVRSGDVVIYTLDGCPACEQAKRILNEWHMNNQTGNKSQFEEMSSDDLPKKLIKKLSDKNGSIAYPIIVINNKHIGGLKELKEITTASTIRSDMKGSFSPVNKGKEGCVIC